MVLRSHRVYSLANKFEHRAGFCVISNFKSISLKKVLTLLGLLDLWFIFSQIVLCSTVCIC